MNSIPGPAASRRRAAIWLTAGLVLLLLVVANGHLVYVAVTSQPECVAHMRQGEVAQDRFSAAKSACSPQREMPQKLKRD